MPDFYARGDQPALDELAQTDLLLDALAKREDVDLDDPDDLHDQALAALLGDWRDDLRWPPASALVSQEEAIEALRAGVEDRQRGRRSMAAVGSVAATLLVLSGFGAVVAEARPGDLLYGLHAMMFNEPRVNDDQILLSAKADLAKVQQMIDQGQWTQAQDQLAEVSSTLQAVPDGTRRQDLIDQVNQLNTKVEKRDPNATVPHTAAPKPQLPASPGSAGKSWTPLVPQTQQPAPPSALEPPPSPVQPPTSAAPATGQLTAPSSPVVTTPPTSPRSAPPSTTSPSTTPPSPSRSPSASPTPTPTPTSTPSPTPTTKKKKSKPTPSSEEPSVTPTTPAAAAPSGRPPGPSGAPSTAPAQATPNAPSPAAQTSGQPGPKPPAASTAP
jgi:hypothetical protein